MVYAFMVCCFLAWEKLEELTWEELMCFRALLLASTAFQLSSVLPLSRWHLEVLLLEDRFANLGFSSTT